MKDFIFREIDRAKEINENKYVSKNDYICNIIEIASPSIFREINDKIHDSYLETRKLLNV